MCMFFKYDARQPDVNMYLLQNVSVPMILNLTRYHHDLCMAYSFPSGVYYSKKPFGTKVHDTA